MFVEKGHLYQLERPRRGRTLACAYHVRPLRGRHNVKKRLFLQRYDLSEVAISFDAFALGVLRSFLRSLPFDPSRATRKTLASFAPFAGYFPPAKTAKCKVA